LDGPSQTNELNLIGYVCKIRGDNHTCALTHTQTEIIPDKTHIFVAYTNTVQYLLPNQ